jgi:CRP-like cAMP-binding protein
MMTAEQQQLYNSLQRLVPISEADLLQLWEIGKIKKYKKGQYIVHEGSVCLRTHFLLSGSAIAFFIDDVGKEHVIQFALEGWWISDIKSFVTGEAAVYNVLANEDCTLIEFPAERLNDVFKKVPLVQSYFLKMTQRAFISFQDRIKQNLSADAAERLANFLTRYQGIDQRFSQKIIASYLGMSPEFYSKILKRRAAASGD